MAVSFIEIYNERVYDLLSEDPSVQIYTRGQKYTGSTRVNVIENNAEAILRKGLFRCHECLFVCVFSYSFISILSHLFQAIKIDMYVQQK